MRRTENRYSCQLPDVKRGRWFFRQLFRNYPDDVRLAGSTSSDALDMEWRAVQGQVVG